MQLVGEEHYNKVMSYIEIAKEEGGNIPDGWKRTARLDKGFFIEPTIITGLTKDSDVYAKKFLVQL